MAGSESIPPDPTFIVGNNGSMQDSSGGDVASGDALSAASPNPAGTALTAADLAALESRWIDGTLAERARLRRVDSLTGGELVGRKRGDLGGIAIPYFMPGSTRVRDYRLRRDQPDLERDSTGQLKTKQKYLSPPGRGNMLYIPPGVDPGLLKNAAVPLIVTEGEFKTVLLGNCIRAEIRDWISGCSVVLEAVNCEPRPVDRRS